MTKKVFYMFGLMAVAIVLGAAGCQQQNSSSSDATVDKAVVDEAVVDNEAAMMELEEVVVDDVVLEGEVKAEAEATAEDETEESPDVVMEDGEVKTFTLEAGMFYFSLKEIKVNKGDKVKIVLNNVGGMHDWVIDEFNARTPQIKVGETAMIEFTADKTGTFEYYCSVGNHRQQGMVGKLVVN